MTSITVRLDDAAARHGLQQVLPAIRRATRRMVSIYQKEYARALRGNAPVRTGALKRSIRVRRHASGARGQYLLAPHMRFYGFILENTASKGWYGWITAMQEQVHDDPGLRAKWVQAIQAELNALGS